MSNEKLINELRGRLRQSQDLFEFAWQFFNAIGDIEKPRFRAADRGRLDALRRSPTYEAAYTAREPLVSVIIPTYNRADILLERTIPSVLAQDYQHWELLIVGDSMPEPESTRLQTGITDPRVRFINLRHRGRYPAAKGPFWYTAGTKPMNVGLRLARGQWVTHLDDDDEYLPVHIGGLLRLARDHRVEWAHGKVDFQIEPGVSMTLVGNSTPTLGAISRIGSLYHGLLKDFRYNPRCWRYFYPADWDLWERFLEMGVTHAHLDIVTGVHHGAPSRVQEAISRSAAAESSPDRTSVTEPTAEEIHQEAYQKWMDNHSLQEIDGQILAERMVTQWHTQPVFHLVMPYHADQQNLLADTLDSLEAQLYGNWHLTIVSDAPPPDPLFTELPVLTWRQCPVTAIGDTVGSALRAPHGDWAAVIPPGTRLAPEALAICGSYVNIRPHWGMFYTDEDEIDTDGKRRRPKFKPDFNLDLLRSTYYLGSLCFVARSVLDALDPPFEITAAAHYDLALRTLDRIGEQAVGHIAEVLCHLPAGLPPFAEDRAGAQAVAAHLTRNGIAAEVRAGYLPRTYQVVYQHPAMPRVAIVVPNKDKVEFLEPCIESLLERTDYPAYELLIVDNQSTDPDLFAYYESLLRREPDRIRILEYPHEFNYSAICNMAVNQTDAEYVLFLNNDTQVLHPEWLSRMMAHAQRPEVGVVGARLVYPETGKIQHAGVVLGVADVANHVFESCFDLKAPGYMNRAQVVQNYSAVTGACQLVRRDRYLAVGGQDEKELKVLLNDIDLCLKLGAQGFKTVWTPFSTLLHHGSISQKAQFIDLERIGKAQARARAERAVMKSRWLDVIANDPAFNPNLSLRHVDMRPDDAVPRNWDVNFRDRQRILGIPLSGGSGHYRLVQPFTALSRAGIAQAEIAPLYQGNGVLTTEEMARLSPDVFVVHAALNDIELSALEDYRKFLPQLRIVFLLDDLISQVPEKSSVYRTFMAGFRDARFRLRRALKSCDRFIASTPYLADSFAGAIDDVVVIPNRLAQDPWCNLTSRRQRGPRPRVGWAGAQQHLGDLEFLLPVVQALHQEVDFVFMGMCPDRLRPYVAEFHDFVPIGEYPAKLAALDIDLALAPLEEIPFNRAKSNLRLLEYGILGWPVICTDIEPYRLYDAPVTRIPNEPGRWIDEIRTMAGSPQRLAAEGDRLRDWVRKGFILEDHLDSWVDGLLRF